MNNKENLQQLIKAIYKVEVVTEEMENNFFEVLQELTAKEERVMRLRYGLDDGVKRTYKEIGEEFGLTASRIHQVTHKAVLKLHHPVRKRKVLNA